MKWNYVLAGGRDLRKAIDEGDVQAVVLHLESCYKELLKAGLIDEYDYDRFEDEAHLSLYGDEIDEDDVDYEMSEFYDLCDALRVWIPV